MSGRLRKRTLDEIGKTSENDGPSLSTTPLWWPDQLQQHDAMTTLTSGIKKELMNPVTAKRGLLQLARTFRQQSVLLLRQADHLDRMADDLTATKRGSKETDGVLRGPRESHFDGMQRGNVIAFVAKSSEAMTSAHKRMDDIEHRLHPWREALHAPDLTPKSKMTTSWSIFLDENYEKVAEMLDAPRNAGVTVKELGRIWRGMSTEERQEYKRRAIVNNNAVKHERESRGPLLHSEGDCAE